AEVLNGKNRVAIYFSAHWCPPCRGFTPVLAEFYEQLKEEDADALEIVFASSDQDDASFGTYFGSMPWTAMPFGSAGKDALSTKFGVRGIPFLVILDGKDGSVKDADGR
ncbi:thioredoxin-like protein, partial [Ochromonadaceae sp. CCMP2298]